MTEYYITYDQAIQSYELLCAFYNSFDNVEDQMMLRKAEQVREQGLDETDLFGNVMYSDRIFDDYKINPMDMDFKFMNVDGSKERIKLYKNLLSLTTSHTLKSSPGREMKWIMYETNTNQVVGFFQFNSPNLNMKPRNVIMGDSFNDDYEKLNRHVINGKTLVPTQPFGFNCIGGKLITLACCSNEVRSQFNEKYDCDIKLFETTALYGSIKPTSQYDGLKPYIKRGTQTESDFMPLPDDNTYHKMLEIFKDDPARCFDDVTSKKLKRIKYMSSVISNIFKDNDDTERLDTLKNLIDEKTKITTKKQYYYSTYGIGNLPDVIRNNSTPKYTIEESRFDFDNLVNWWKIKAQKRYDKLKESKSLRKEVELWTLDNIKNRTHQIIR